MNTFSNSLFTFLFGWVRTLIESIWNAAAAGKFSRFLTWLGDHWLFLALWIVVLCTAADFLVWLIRWRPYLVWKTQLRRLSRFLRGEKVDGRRRFSRGYQEAVDMGFSGPETPPPERQPLFQQEAPPAWQPEYQESYVPEEEEPLAEEFESPAYDVPADQPEARRRRRSKKHEQKTRSVWRQRLAAPDDDAEDGLLDGLPPAVDKEQAFHEPVYPTVPNLNWQNQPGQSMNGKNA